MCGIVGYVGKEPALPIVLKGLQWLLPRGYDSAGVSLLYDGKFFVRKGPLEKGNFKRFADALLAEQEKFLSCTNGIAHTRWATHGEANQVNAHPHCFEKISLVHNGIIENYRELKSLLEAEGYVFLSETDSEVIAVLFAYKLKKYAGDIHSAIIQTVNRLQGTFGLLIQHADDPTMLIGVRKDSPLSYMKLADGSFMIASTAEPFLEYGNHGKHLSNGEIVLIRNGEAEEFSFEDKPLEIPEVEFEGCATDILKEGYPDYMLKEIMIQPDLLPDVFRGRLSLDGSDPKLGGIEGVMPKLTQMKHFFFFGAGTSKNAAEIIARMFREHLNVHAEAKLASEVGADNVLAGCDPRETVIFCISQSGETADLLAAIHEMRLRNVALIIGIVNVVGSTIARETDAGVYLHVGNELGVASTKAFSAQVLVGAMICILLARSKGMTQDRSSAFVRELLSIPEKIRMVLKQADEMKRISERIKDSVGIMLLGRGYHQISVFEGGLKIIEVGYMWREVQPAGEMKHGPIAIIDEGATGNNRTPVIVVATRDSLRTQVFSNISEIKARNAYVIGICTEGDTEMMEHVHESITIPEVCPELSPILAVVVLQLFAYYIGVMRGNNVDQPRNLAKAVTVL